VTLAGLTAIDWKALSKRIGHADVAFTMKQYVQTDLEADREVANTLADRIINPSHHVRLVRRSLGHNHVTRTGRPRDHHWAPSRSPTSPTGIAIHVLRSQFRGCGYRAVALIVG
jgi:hypothetical protein